MNSMRNFQMPSYPYVASHLELKNTLARAKEEMDAAAKAAQEEARNKAKNNKKPSSESAGKVDPAAEEEQKKEPEPPRTPGLFDYPAEPQSAPKPARGCTCSCRCDLCVSNGDCIRLRE
jgi:hypothetical protein